MPFRDWIRSQTEANGRVGVLARSVFKMSLPDADRKSLRKFLQDSGVEVDMLKAFDVSYRVYREQACP